MLPAIIAVFAAVLLAVLLFVPFVAREHRKRGELGAGSAVLRFAALLYLLGLVAYVLIPLPPVGPGFCAAFAHLQPQLRPFTSLAGVPRPHAPREFAALLLNDQVRQFGLNMLLFVPLGMFGRHLLRRGIFGILLVGFATSLLIELTQLTGLWFLYPCPYRLFDVDDLIANTAGAAAGRVLAPSLRLLPGQHSGMRATVQRPVTAYRRLLGMACDVLLLWWIGGTVLRITDLVLDARGIRWSHADRMWLGSIALWFGPAVLLLLITVIGRGSSLGQHAVLLRSAAPGRRRPSPGAVLRRWSVGLGGLGMLQGVVSAAGFSVLWFPLTVLWCTMHAFGIARGGDCRGLSGRFAGLTVVDARRPPPQLRSSAPPRENAHDHIDP